MMRYSLLSLAFLIGCPGGKDSQKDSVLESTPISADEDGDGIVDGDCNDNDASIYPGAPETCDGIDQDCDGTIDNNPTDGQTYYQDSDADGYGTDTAPFAACALPEGYSEQAGDCNDSDPTYSPAASESCTDTNDYNCDGLISAEDADQDGFVACEDCNDTDPSIYPGAPETCDGIDQDCDGTLDNNPAEGPSFYADLDNDGYGDPNNSIIACAESTGYIADNTDCNDTDPAYHPGATESCTDTVDYNCDGSIGFSDLDNDGYAACQECNDGDASINPGAQEICDSIDNNCDGQTDGSDAANPPTWYEDRDNDGYGNAASTQNACSAPTGYVADNTDCNDSLTAVNPAATEICDAADLDENCNGLSDDADTTVDLSSQSTYYADADQDGYGDPSQSIQACDLPANTSTDAQDCNDTDPAYHPGATEDCGSSLDLNCDGAVGNIDNDGDGYFACQECNDGDAAINPGATEACDSIDNNCDGQIDEAGAIGETDFYADADLDGYGDPNQVLRACTQPPGYLSDAQDCNDSNSLIYPNATEYCNGVDDNCNTTIDEQPLDGSNWYTDSDQDGFGDATQMTVACSQPNGAVADNSDCNDTESAINPAAQESCDANNIDENCNGASDDSDPFAIGQSTFFADTDADNYGDSTAPILACDQPNGAVTDRTDCNDADAAINPAATEICDANDTDENCDGLSDNADANAVGQTTYYTDADGDNYGDSAAPILACDLPIGSVVDSTDCNDTDAAINPAAQEICDATNTDEDCDGQSDDADLSATGKTTFFVDGDADGYGDINQPYPLCDISSVTVTDNTDCDDTNPSINPGATEVCDAANIDENCNGLSDDADPSATQKQTYYTDSDGDGYGNVATATEACDQPAQTVTDSTDCNDAIAAINPSATEICDANDTDEDCDGLSDDADASATGQSTFYRDQDADGFGNPAIDFLACDLPNGAIDNNFDCNDGNAAINPNAQEVCDAANTDEDCSGQSDDNDANATGQVSYYADQDGDGYGDLSQQSTLCDQPAQTVTDSTDCNDAIAAINPGATEICDANNTDEDCDGLSDDADSSATGQVSYYADQDGDGYGDIGQQSTLCDQPTQTVTDNTDCNDAIAAINPAATEICDANNTDEDCDGLSDDADGSAVGQGSYYADNDNDGYGNPSQLSTLCDQPAQTVTDNTDCNDAIAAINPAAQEICDANNTDEDCDGQSDDNDNSAVGQITYYADQDGDSYGDLNQQNTLCDQPAQTVTDSTDCNDAIATINPAATEICDANDTDEDCDGLSDDADSSVVGQGTYYNDHDNDGYGNPSQQHILCDQPAQTVTDNTDCNDNRFAINPAAQEMCDADNTDEDCDGLSDDADSSATGQSAWYNDQDGDNYGDVSTQQILCDQPTGTVALSTDCDDSDSGDYPGASEIIGNNDDEDCDGSETCYDDDDNDGYLDSSADTRNSSDLDCNDPFEGSNTSPTTDCDDSTAIRNPGAIEVCDPSDIDEDCNNLADDADSQTSNRSTFYQDNDSDSYGDVNNSFLLCDQPANAVADSTDCDDNNSAINPAAQEVCDASNTDEDCDGLSDDADSSATGQTMYYADNDADGYGVSTGQNLCDQPEGSITDNTDCDDTNISINPSATEICGNGIDEDCSSVDNCEWSGINFDTDANSSDIGVSPGTGAAPGFFGGDIAAGFYDIDGDAYPDLAIGDRNFDTTSNNNRGRAYILRGGGSGITDTVTSPFATMTGASDGDALGQGLSFIMDIDGDGDDEVVVGDYKANPNAVNDSGATLLFLGGPSMGTLATTNAYITIQGNTKSEYQGWSVSDGGDLDDNGVNDWVTAGFAPINSGTNANPSNKGVVAIIPSNLAAGTYLSNNVNFTARITGATNGDRIGSSVLGNIDIDGNGDADLLIASAQNSTIYVYTSALTGNLTTANADATITGATFNYNASFEVNSGNAIVSAGDNNGDGYNDLLIGNDGYDSAITNIGQANLILGTAGFNSGSLSSLSATTLSGIAASDFVGRAVSSGDFDGDTYSDLLIGASGFDLPVTDVGAAVILYGPSTGTYAVNGTTPPDGTAVFLGTNPAGSFGSAAASSDWNMDGYDDFIIGEPNHAPVTAKLGATYVFMGNAE